jgi:cation:H+ antiporter
MELALNAAGIGVGIVVLVLGADAFTAAAIQIAHRLRVPELVIGATLVSVATTLPELAVSVTAAVSHKADLAVGNAVGSTIFNVGAILGFSALFAPIVIQALGFRRSVGVLLAIEIGFTVVCLALGSINRIIGCVLLVAAGVYVIGGVRMAVPDSGPTDSTGPESKFALPGRPEPILSRFLLGAGAVFVGSALVVHCASELAFLLHVPPLVVSLTLVAAGTSLPEMVVSLTGILRSRRSLSVGNILGANVLNLTWVLGLSAVITDLPIQPRTRLFDLPVTIVLSVVLLVLGARDYRLARWEGVVLLGAYAVYLGVTLANPAGPWVAL